MKKYIDAEKLKAEIKRLKKHSEDSKKEWTDEGYNQNAFAEDCRIASFDKLLSFIASLQQEQPEPSNNLVDVDAVREDFMTEVYRVLDADSTNDRANAIIDAFDSLPTVSQNQPEVDLDKAARHVYESWMGGTMDDVRRDMVELGKVLNARKK